MIIMMTITPYVVCVLSLNHILQSASQIHRDVCTLADNFMLAAQCEDFNHSDQLNPSTTGSFSIVIHEPSFPSLHCPRFLRASLTPVCWSNPLLAWSWSNPSFVAFLPAIAQRPTKPTCLLYTYLFM